MHVNGLWETQSARLQLQISSVVSELTEYTESKMIIFASGPLQSLRLFLIIVNYAYGR